MMLPCYLVALIVYCSVFLCETHFAKPSIFVRDLTHTLQPDIPVYPGLKKFDIVTFFDTLNDVTYKSENFSTATHIGTHVDAPSHFANGTWNIDEIPLDRLIAPAIVIDIRHKSLKNPKAQLTVDDLIAWQLKYGKIPYRSVVLVETGWDRYWENKEKYLGIQRDGTVSGPGVSPQAAKWILENTSAHAIGIDRISIDNGDSLITHVLLSRYFFYFIENLKDLDKIPPTGATISVLPMKIKAGSGAPARVIASYLI